MIVAASFLLDAFSFSTGIERRHVARLVESDLPRDRHIQYPVLFIFHSTKWLAPVFTQAGMFLTWSAQKQFCNAVHMV